MSSGGNSDPALNRLAWLVNGLVSYIRLKKPNTALTGSWTIKINSKTIFSTNVELSDRRIKADYNEALIPNGLSTVELWKGSEFITSIGIYYGALSTRPFFNIDITTSFMPCDKLVNPQSIPRTSDFKPILMPYLYNNIMYCGGRENVSPEITAMFIAKNADNTGLRVAVPSTTSVEEDLVPSVAKKLTNDDRDAMLSPLTKDYGNYHNLSFDDKVIPFIYEVEDTIKTSTGSRRVRVTQPGLIQNSLIKANYVLWSLLYHSGERAVLNFLLPYWYNGVIRADSNFMSAIDEILSSGKTLLDLNVMKELIQSGCVVMSAARAIAINANLHWISTWAIFESLAYTVYVKGNGELNFFDEYPIKMIANSGNDYYEVETKVVFDAYDTMPSGVQVVVSRVESVTKKHFVLSNNEMDVLYDSSPKVGYKYNPINHETGSKFYLPRVPYTFIRLDSDVPNSVLQIIKTGAETGYSGAIAVDPNNGGGTISKMGRFFDNLGEKFTDIILSVDDRILHGSEVKGITDMLIGVIRPSDIFRAVNSSTLIDKQTAIVHEPSIVSNSLKFAMTVKDSTVRALQGLSTEFDTAEDFSMYDEKEPYRNDLEPSLTQAQDSEPASANYVMEI